MGRAVYRAFKRTVSRVAFRKWCCGMGGDCSLGNPGPYVVTTDKFYCTELKLPSNVFADWCGSIEMHKEAGLEDILSPLYLCVSHTKT